MREDEAQEAGEIEQKEAQRERRRSSDSSAEDDRVRRNEKHERRERKWSREEHRNPADEAAELFKDVDRGPFLRVDKRGNGRGWSPFAAQRAAGGGRYTWLQRKVTFSSRIFSSGCPFIRRQNAQPVSPKQCAVLSNSIQALYLSSAWTRLFLVEGQNGREMNLPGYLPSMPRHAWSG